MGSGKITELFGMLPEWAAAGIETQEIMNILKGEAEEPDVGDVGYDIAMEGQGMSFFDQILAETGDVKAAIGSAKNQAMIDLLAGEHAEDINIERIKINEAAKAAIEAPDIATQLLSEAPPNFMDESIIRLRLLEDTPVTDLAANFAKELGVNSTDVVKAINLQLEEIESEDAEWAFDPGQMQMQMGLTAPDPWASVDKGGLPGEGQALVMEQAALEAGVPDAAADQAQSVANVQDSMIAALLADLPPSDETLEARKEEKAALRLLWDKLPQILGPNQAQIYSGYEDQGQAIKDLIAEWQKQFEDYDAYAGLDMDYYEAQIGAILNSEVAKGTEWEGTTVDHVISQWASASPDVMALRSEGNIDYLLSSNTDIKAWFDQAVEQGFSTPMIGTGMKAFASGIRGKELQAEPEWWTNLSPTVQAYLMGAVNKAREGVTPVTVDPADVPAAFEITPLMQNWITNTVAFTMQVPDYSDPGTIGDQSWAKDLDQKALEAIQAEVQSQIVAAQQAVDPTSAATTAVATGAPTQTTLDQIIQLGNTMTTAPDVSLGGYEFIGMPSTTGWGTVGQARLWRASRWDMERPWGLHAVSAGRQSVHP